MSHISKIELEVNDLATLKRACARLGLRFVENQKTFKWFGYDEGRCDHAIKVPGAAYEIGVTKAGTLYGLQCDYYDSALSNVIGQNSGLLKQAYVIERTKTEVRRKGYSLIEKKTDSGIRLHIRVT
jgi:hypothetical protein